MKVDISIVIEVAGAETDRTPENWELGLELGLPSTIAERLDVNPESVTVEADVRPARSLGGAGGGGFIP